jgi:hypothetical protein
MIRDREERAAGRIGRAVRNVREGDDRPLLPRGEGDGFLPRQIVATWLCGERIHAGERDQKKQEQEGAERRSGLHRDIMRRAIRRGNAIV